MHNYMLQLRTMRCVLISFMSCLTSVSETTVFLHSFRHVFSVQVRRALNGHNCEPMLTNFLTGYDKSRMVVYSVNSVALYCTFT